MSVCDLEEWWALYGILSEARGSKCKWEIIIWEAWEWTHIYIVNFYSGLHEPCKICIAKWHVHMHTSVKICGEILNFRACTYFSCQLSKFLQDLRKPLDWLLLYICVWVQKCGTTNPLTHTYILFSGYPAFHLEGSGTDRRGSQHSRQHSWHTCINLLIHPPDWWQLRF